MPGKVIRPPKAPEPEPENEYEAQIAKNKANIKALMSGLKKDLTAIAPTVTTSKKRKLPAKTPKPKTVTEPTRKSSRISSVVTQTQSLEDFSDDEDQPRKKSKNQRQLPSGQLESDSERDEIPLHRQPKINGKVFGPIWGVKVGDWWEKRDECGRCGVHPPTVAGIFGSGEKGAYSVAVSAGYPEDRDDGDRFIYTGSGGRELKKKNLRTAPQSSDQKLERGNLALFVSAQTGKPIRVIRGYKAELGPLTGYRYDGLYKVERAYEAKNSNGKFKVWKFDFVRLPGQAPVDYEGKRRADQEMKKYGDESEDNSE